MEREGRASLKAPLLEHGSEKGILKHVFPMNLFLKPWKLGEWVYQVIKFGIVQYVCAPSFRQISCLYSLTWFIELCICLSWYHKFCADDYKGSHCYFSCSSWSFWSILWRWLQAELWVRFLNCHLETRVLLICVHLLYIYFRKTHILCLPQKVLCCWWVLLKHSF